MAFKGKVTKALMSKGVQKLIPSKAVRNELRCYL